MEQKFCKKEKLSVFFTYGSDDDKIYTGKEFSEIKKFHFF